MPTPTLPSSLCAVAMLSSMLAPLGLAHAQQPNTAGAALSIHGTGKLTPAGVVPTSSQLSPVPLGGAPLYWHRVQARSAVGFRVQGPAGAPIILLGGLPGPAVDLGPGVGLLELSVPSLTFLVNGFEPTSFLNLSAFVGSSGSWTLGLGQGLPWPMPPLTFQAAVFDPISPLGLRLSASLTLDVRNDLETLNRNLVDAYSVPGEPGYGPSLCAPTFLWDGRTASTFGNSGGDRAVFRSVLPNASNAPPLPTGAPAPGQSTTYALEGEELMTSPVPGIPAVLRFRDHDLIATESLGAWKLNGNQRDAYIKASVAFYPGATKIEFSVQDDGGLHGNNASAVTLTGPQLAGLTTFMAPETVAISAASATITVPKGTSNTPGVAWSFHLVVGTGASRQPWVENASGPRDVYQFTIHWADGATSGPYSTALRAALDVTTAAAAVAATIPGAGTPTAVLTNAGMPNANLAVTLHIGAAPGAGSWSALQLRIVQGNAEWRARGLQPNPAIPVQTINLSVPGMLAGVPTQVTLERIDVYENFYRRYVMFTL